MTFTLTETTCFGPMCLCGSVDLLCLCGSFNHLCFCGSVDLLGFSGSVDNLCLSMIVVCSIFKPKFVGCVHKFLSDSTLEPAGSKPGRGKLLAMIVLVPVEVEAEVGDAAEILTLGQCGPRL